MKKPALKQLAFITGMMVWCALNLQAQNPPSITTQPASQLVSPGTNVVVSVTAGGTGPFTYQWQLNGSNLPNNTIATVAGTNRAGFSGDGGPANQSVPAYPYGVATDASGNLFIADTENNRVRKVDTNLIITTVAGNGIAAFSGDGGLATNASLSFPNWMALDPSGNLYINDYNNGRIRKVDTNGIITTVAGNGISGVSGDGGLATNASLYWPTGIALDAANNLFFGEYQTGRVRKVNANGIITTAAGSATVGFSGDGGAATNAKLNGVQGVAFDATGNLYISDQINGRVRKVTTNGIITTFAGGGSGGDGGPATNAALGSLYGVTIDATGVVYIAESEVNRIRKVDTNGVISRAAGGGLGGDGSFATNAGLNYPVDIAVDPSGSLYIADTFSGLVREVPFGGRPMVSIPSADTNNAGDYTVIVSNPYGSITSAVATLNLIRPPWFVIQPASQAVFVGSNATLNAAAGGSHPLTYSWYFNATNLVQTGTNALLIMNGVTGGNAGQYSVIVTDTYGSVTSQVAILSVVMYAATETGLSGTYVGRAAWGDYNNDGFSDLLLGNQVYQNSGGTAFSNANITLGVGNIGAWGDYDCDGNLDILEADSSSATIYRNLGNGTFTNLNLGFASTISPCIAWGDYNNDGKPDVLVCGNLYRNNGGGSFTQISTGVPQVQYGAVCWGDYDHDGRLDILIAGLGDGNAICRVYHNDGSGTFTDIGASLPGVTLATAAWVDYDGDGWLDIFVAGNSNGIPITQLFRNLGNGTFTNVNAGFSGVQSPVAAWADYDNDGAPDLFLSGLASGGKFFSQVYHNNRDGTFTPFTLGLTNVALAEGAAWGDFNNDRRLDIFLSGYTLNSASISGLYQGLVPTANTAPTPPSTIPVLINANSLTFRWSPATDQETPTSALSYNLRVGSSPGALNVVSPMSDTNGFRRLPQSGNAGGALSWTLTNVNLGTYYWSVQSIDTAFAGSPFSAEQTFIFGAETLPASGVNSTQAVFNGVILDSVLPATCYFEWGMGTNRDHQTTPLNINASITNPVISVPIVGLLPGTTYGCHFVLTNTNSIFFGGEQSFTTLNVPHIIPQPESNITAISASLSALVNPSGAATTVYFEYGLTPAYGNSTAVTNIGNGSVFIPVNLSISGLVGGQVYLYHVVATNAVGSAYSTDLTFQTTMEPEVATDPATSIGPVSATLNGSVRPNTLTTTAFFQFGLTTNYGFTTSPVSVGNGVSLVSVGATITSLTRVTTYHFRVVGTNASGTTYGQDVSFLTTNDVIALAATGIGITNATLNGDVNPNGLTTSVVFQYGLTTNLGSSTPVISLNADTNLLPVSCPIIGLVSGSNYFYQVVATNSAGVRFSSITSFQVPPLFSPLSTNLAGFINGEMAWGDYDNDGRLDMLVSDATSTRLYHNNTNAAFTLVSTAIPGVTSGTLAWGDYNADGRLDVLVTGNSSAGPITRVYRNNGNGTFTDIHAGLPNVAFRSAIWGDFDNDGKPDILLVGETNSVGISKIYHNNGDGTFTDMQSLLPAFLDASASCADYDNDGRLDILLSGRIGTEYANVFAQLMHNDGNGAFHDSGVSFAGVRLGFADWGDYDGDGNLDLILGGLGTGLNNILRLYRNNGDGTFSDQTGSLPLYSPDTVFWGDYDNDGLPDLLVRGQQYISSRVPPASDSAVLRNNGNGTFTATKFPLPEIWSSAGGWIDYDGDGRLDAVISGNSRTGGILLFYHNNFPVTNNIPSTPTALASVVSSNGVKLSYAKPSNILSYNLRVGVTPGGGEVLSSLSASNGLRKVVAPGNAGVSTNFFLTNLPYGVYYWSVQAINAGFVGSPFAPLNTFGPPGPPAAITLSPVIVTSTRATIQGSVQTSGLDTTAQFQWGNTTNLGSAISLGLIPASAGTNLELAQLSNLLPGTSYFYQIGVSNSLGNKVASIIQFTTAKIPIISSITLQPGNMIQLQFAGSSGFQYNVYASTNLLDWTNLGAANNFGPNLFRFNSFVTTNYPYRFFRIAAP